MVKMIRVAEILRYQENFNDYIHMKAIPGASQELIDRLGRLVDRMSINIELAQEESLKTLAPDKDHKEIRGSMSFIKESISEYREDRKKFKSTPLFLPAGQSSQMIIGASQENDLDIITRSEELYQSYRLKRVFYSAYVPVVKSDLLSGVERAPLLREHRLYQADWLLRFYDFKSSEILTPSKPNLDLSLDSKATWAIENIHLFPMEINKASYKDLIRILGIGKTYAKRIVDARKFSRLSFYSLDHLKISLKRAIHFITVDGKYRGGSFKDQEDLRALLADEKVEKGRQLTLFD